MRNFHLAVTAVVLLGLSLPVSSQRRQPETTEIDGHTMYTLLESGAIPAIFEPEFVSVDAAEDLYHPDEPVLVVSLHGETHAYSTWHLDQHEIVNDRIGDTWFAATW